MLIRPCTIIQWRNILYRPFQVNRDSITAYSYFIFLGLDSEQGYSSYLVEIRGNVRNYPRRSQEFLVMQLLVAKYPELQRDFDTAYLDFRPRPISKLNNTILEHKDNIAKVAEIKSGDIIEILNRMNNENSGYSPVVYQSIKNYIQANESIDLSAHIQPITDRLFPSL